VLPTPTSKSDPLLRNVTPAEFPSQSWLYKLSPLSPTATPLLLGQIKDTPPEPVAHLTTHLAAPIFFTSLGHPADFQSPQFPRLLLNAIEYTLDHPIPR
ncbi:MAG: nicotinamidase, partial [Planctomycetota bacterium]|nr:nicotinamidase [Planctomycetota bacterium]